LHHRHQTAWGAESPAPPALRLPALPLLLTLLPLRSLLLANRRRRRCHQIHPSRHLVKRGFLQSSLLLLISGCASRWESRKRRVCWGNKKTTKRLLRLIERRAIIAQRVLTSSGSCGHRKLHITPDIGLRTSGFRHRDPSPQAADDLHESAEVRSPEVSGVPIVGYLTSRMSRIIPGRSVARLPLSCLMAATV